MFDNDPREKHVWIRKSSSVQEDKAQRENVGRGLKELGIYVPEEFWHVVTVKRKKVTTNPEFQRMMQRVDAGKVAVVFIESQIRLGTIGRGQLFTVLDRFREGDTVLWDLRNRRDLAAPDIGSEVVSVVTSIKSEEEVRDLAGNVMRSKTDRFNDGSWPCGAQPYGYAKKCVTPDGKLLWVWQPSSRLLGQVFYADKDGNLIPGPEGVRVPRKNKGTGDLTKLIPSADPNAIKAIRLIFELYVSEGLSRRKIALRLNQARLYLYGRPWCFTEVDKVLSHPAYAGDTPYGRREIADYWTFDLEGKEVAVGRGKVRNGQYRLKKNTHEGLIDRDTWEQTQAKIRAEREALRTEKGQRTGDRRVSHSPRNPEYYLKQLLVCGHCGKGMRGRPVTHGNGKRVVTYVCSSYDTHWVTGDKDSCGFHCVRHDVMEEILLEKARTTGFTLDTAPSSAARLNIDERLARLGLEDEASLREWHRWLSEGIDALVTFLSENYPGMDEYPAVQKVRKLGLMFYCGDYDNEPNGKRPFKALPVDLGAVRQAVREAEREVADQARRKVEELTEEHKRLTRVWAKANEEMQAVLKDDIEKLQAERKLWEARTVPLSRRKTSTRPRPPASRSARSSSPSTRAWRRGRRGKP